MLCITFCTTPSSSARQFVGKDREMTRRQRNGDLKRHASCGPAHHVKGLSSVAERNSRSKALECFLVPLDLSDIDSRCIYLQEAPGNGISKEPFAAPRNLPHVCQTLAFFCLASHWSGESNLFTAIMFDQSASSSCETLYAGEIVDAENL